MRYWWVNHKQTSRHEIAGGFLWSPMYKSNGAKNYFYDTMREASPGDPVISFSNAQISYFGVVTDFASPAPKPPSFGKAGENWDKNKGWILPVEWKALKTSVRPKLKIDELRKLLPSKYSPISLNTGDGNQGAYLAKVDQSVFECLIGQGEMLMSTVPLAASPVSKVLEDIDSAIEREILDDRGLDSTTKQRLVQARIGQGVFKERIYAFENACRLTKVQTSGLLIASHIKPWRLCETAAERLDGANGLLLTPHVDFLFDRGYLSFEPDGEVLISKKLNDIDLHRLGLDSLVSKKRGSFHTLQQPYLEFHRDKIFLK